MTSRTSMPLGFLLLASLLQLAACEDGLAPGADTSGCLPCGSDASAERCLLSDDTCGAPECDANRPCGGRERCINLECVPVDDWPCETEASCDAGQICLEGTCRTPCTTSADCSAWSPWCSPEHGVCLQCGGPVCPPDGAMPRLSVSPTVVTLPPTVVGASRSAEIIVTNVGELPLNVERLQLVAPEGVAVETGDWSYGSTLEPVPAKLNPVEPGQSATIRVVFAPQQPGPMSGRLVLFSNDRAQRDGTVIALDGTGLAPCLEATPTSVDFGLVEGGARVTRDVTFRVCNDVTIELFYVGLRNGFQIQVRHFAKPSITHGLRAATTGHQQEPAR